jgi:alpha-beta hydrolase superfamily lysophospholipase
MTLDGFFFNGTPVEAYALQTELIEPSCLEVVSYDAADGTALYGAWAHRPMGEDCASGNTDLSAPMIVFFHGNAENLDRYVEWMDIYWDLGFVAFTWDYRGFGMSEGDATWENIISDGRDTLDYLESTSARPASDMTYLGLSLGGFAAIHQVPERPPRRFITEDMFASSKKMLDDGTDLDLPEGWFFAKDWDNTAIARSLPADVPYLVMHAAGDTYIQPGHGQAVYDAAASELKRLWWVDGADHAEDPVAQPEAYRENVLCWATSVDPGGCL